MDLPLSPLPGKLRVWLFKDVENVKQLRDSIIGKTNAGDDDDDDRNDDEKGAAPRKTYPPRLAFPDASFLDASLVPDLWTLRLAAFAAEAAAKRGRARSRSRHTELVVALSGGKNISAALAKFGLSDGARHLLVARFVDDGDRDDKADEDEASAGAAFAAAVRGTRVPAAEVEAELASVSDAAAQIGAFKIAMSAAAAEREEGGEEGGGGGERGGGERGGGGGERGGGERGGGGARGPRRGAAAAAAGRGGAGGGEVGPLSAAVACRIALRDC